MENKFIQSKYVDKFEKEKVLAYTNDLKMSLKTKSGSEKLIIDSTSIKIREGEILGIIGESGSGKTVITTAFTGLNSDIQVVSEGKIVVGDYDVSNWTAEEWEQSKLRGKFVSQVFQNPLSSLNPYRTVGSQIIESIRINSEKKISKQEAFEEAIELLKMVRINDPIEVMRMYPHQMSGGMNQRIVIITILAAKPKLIILDEPTTALDPAVQAQIVEIVREIAQKTRTAMILISHDLALVASLADSIAIMYAGRVVEYGIAEEVIKYPLHPYTWGLLMSIPAATNKELYSIPGTVPSDISKIVGDAFAPRNKYSMEIDFILKPPGFYASKSHIVYSWLYDESAPKFTPPKIILESWEEFAKK